MSAETDLQELKKQIHTPELPALGPGPRVGVLSPAAVDEAVDRYARASALPGDRKALVRALVLLWHDHLELAHVIAQGIDTADGSLLHGILHRREPDYSNAKYWLHQASGHPVYPELTRRVTGILGSGGAEQPGARLVAGGNWDPMAFVDACEAVAGRPPGDPDVARLREIQLAEFELLLDYFCRRGRA